jgi:hypothetical protein
VILSGSSVASQNVLDEINFALDEGQSIIPLLKRIAGSRFASAANTIMDQKR